MLDFPGSFEHIAWDYDAAFSREYIPWDNDAALMHVGNTGYLCMSRDVHRVLTHFILSAAADVQT